MTPTCPLIVQMLIADPIISQGLNGQILFLSLINLIFKVTTDQTLTKLEDFNVVTVMNVYSNVVKSCTSPIKRRKRHSILIVNGVGVGVGVGFPFHSSLLVASDTGFLPTKLLYFAFP